MAPDRVSRNEKKTRRFSEIGKLHYTNSVATATAITGVRAAIGCNLGSCHREMDLGVLSRERQYGQSH